MASCTEADTSDGGTEVTAVGPRGYSGGMRTDLDHLPSNKRTELQRVVKVLLEEFEDATRLGLSKTRKTGRILKIVLFGSYARGDWVEDKKSGYSSDYDLLVVVNHEELTDLATYWGRADEHLMREVTVTGRLSAPVNFIVHTLADVNDQLSRGRYFFTDIVRDGVVLYQSDATPFAPADNLAPEEASSEAAAYFERWLAGGTEFLETAKFAARQGFNNKSAFLLHQAAEQFYVCVLLTLTVNRNRDALIWQERLRRPRKKLPCCCSLTVGAN